jgi:trimethylamine--corrinoid protein Co-methyltransferase
MRPQLNVLSNELIGEILGEAKRIMSETGMEIRGEKLRNRLLDHGLKTDANGRVLFTPDVVDAAIASAPKSFTLHDRDGEPYTEIGGNNVHYVPGSSGLKVQDHRTGETRLSNSTDFIEYARLCSGLDHIAYLATAFSTNKDIESQVSDAWRLYMCMTTSKKPIVSGAFSEEGVPRMVEMMQMFRADRADLIEKPGEDSCQNLLDCVEAGIPVEIVPVTLMGLIAPVTLVGALVFHCVDVLTGITMAQIVRPGAPVLFGGAPATFHMKAASSPMAAIEAQHGNVPHEGREFPDGRDRGAAPQRGVRADREIARLADAGLHGAERRKNARRTRWWRDIQQRAACGDRRRELGVGSWHARLRPDVQPAQARIRQ